MELTTAEIIAWLTDVAGLAPTGSKWRHLKSNHDYLVTGHCMIEATARPGIMYARRLGDETFSWVRDADEFLDGRFLRLAKTA